MTISRDQQGDERAGGLPVALIAGYLREVLGERLTAVVAGTDDAEVLRRWVRGEEHPRGGAENRLRDSYEVVQILLEHEAPSTVRAWFRGMNPFLEDEAPALMIGKDPRRVMAAANAFQTGSYS